MHYPWILELNEIITVMLIVYTVYLSKIAQKFSSINKVNLQYVRERLFIQP